MATKSHHVIPMNDGWKVRKGGAERALKSFDNEQAAIEFARTVSKNQHSELYIHKKDGTVQTKESYSNGTNQQKN